MNIWRNDELFPGRPTISTVVQKAEDIIETSGPYSLKISHVRSFHGKGFMATAGHFEYGWHCNGEVFLGEDQEAYNKAIADGKEMIQSKLDEDEAFFADLKKKRLEGSQ